MKILVFNQYYPPDSAATAGRLGDLCQGLADRHEITVICGYLSYDPMPESPATAETRVHPIRVPSTTFHRSWMLGRISNYLSYLTSAFFVGLFQKRPNLVVSMTDPFVIGLIAWFVARVKRVPFVYIIQDLYPDVLVQLGIVKETTLTRMIDRMNLFLLNRAKKVIAISPSMKEKLIKKGVEECKIVIIPNGANISAVKPEQKENPFSLEHGFSEKFVVMYSGNLGLSQSLHFLLDSAKRLQELRDLIFVIIGEGAGKSRLMKKARELGLPNVFFFPYQPMEEMRYSFASADIFIVPLAAGLDGMIVPSKVFSIMASGRPFIAAIDRTSEVARIADEYRCGLVIQPDSSEKLSDAIRWAYEERVELRAMGKRGREAVECHYSTEVAIVKYEREFIEVMNCMV